MSTSPQENIGEKRIIAKFRPQAWINDNAVQVDAEGPSKWDVTEHILGMGYEEFSKLCDRDYPSDELSRLETAPKWIRDWSGPFEVDVMVSVGKYFTTFDPDLITRGNQIPREHYETVAAHFAEAKKSGQWRAMTPEEIEQAETALTSRTPQATPRP